ncbi:hypothetical protein MP638_002246 [Amoeboaphelidium occidentale]|jgi:hypothetical protein|nr:hypothetical protein MP638_002246 [Amoeboaphelidium occidentale]
MKFLVLISILLATLYSSVAAIAFPACGLFLEFTFTPLSYFQAQQFCRVRGGRLLDVTSANFVCIRNLFTAIGVTVPVYVGSWNGDNYNNAGIAFYPGGAIAVPPGAPAAPFFGICQF